MKKIITFGVFDYFHFGHLRLLERAKSYGDYLIVAVQDGDRILRTKPEAKIFYTTEQRVELIQALRMVDEVVVYKDVDSTLPEVDFDVFVLGGDQVHEGFQRAIRWCEDHGKGVIRLQRTPGVSSSAIKDRIISLG